MNTQKLQEKSKISNKKLRNFVVILSLLGTTASYVEAQGIRCEREIIGGAVELNRVMHRKDVISDETTALVKQKILGSDPLKEKALFSATRLFQERDGENVLEIQNNNSKPLTIILLDQGSNLSTELGVVHANKTGTFRLDRNTLYDTYSVKGYLGFLRSDTYANLSFKKFYTKIVFQSNIVGTEAQLDRTADVY